MAIVGEGNKLRNLWPPLPRTYFFFCVNTAKNGAKDLLRITIELTYKEDAFLGKKLTFENQIFFVISIVHVSKFFEFAVWTNCYEHFFGYENRAIRVDQVYSIISYLLGVVNCLKHVDDPAMRWVKIEEVRLCIVFSLLVHAEDRRPNSESRETAMQLYL